MRFEYCPSHPDCQIVDGVHTPKHATSRETFPEWPPTQEEVRRGVADSELMPQLDALQQQVAEAVERVDRFGPTAEKVESDLRSFLDRSDRIVQQIEQTERTVGTSEATVNRLAELSVMVRGIAAEVRADAPKREAFQRADGHRSAEQVKALRTHLQMLLATLRETGELQTEMGQLAERLTRAEHNAAGLGAMVAKLREESDAHDVRVGGHIAALNAQATTVRAELDQLGVANEQQRAELASKLGRAEAILAKLDNFDGWLKRLAGLERALVHERAERIENHRKVMRSFRTIGEREGA